MRRESTPITVKLEGDLEGYTILVSPSALTMGLLEDIQSGQTSSMLDSVAATLQGGDLPFGFDRAGIRQLTPSEFGDLCAGVAGVVNVKKRN